MLEGLAKTSTAGICYIVEYSFSLYFLNLESDKYLNQYSI